MGQEMWPCKDGGNRVDGYLENGYMVGFGSGPRKVAMQRWVDGYLENGYVV